MTREEAIEIIELEKRHCKIHLNDSEKVDNDEYYEVMNGFVEAYDMAIKALEQQSVLDKIIAEIEKEINSPNRGTCDYFIVDRIEEIIDKYKAESEEEG